VLFRARELELIAAGQVSVAFRYWIKAAAKAGGTQRTAVGVLAIDAVEAVEEARLTLTDAQAAGHTDVESLLAALGRRGEGTLFRIRLRLLGADPRVELRSRTRLSDAELLQVLAKLASLDRHSRHGAWTERTLACISAHPARLAAKLAAELGYEKEWFKVNVRKLKELGLTESLEIGYRLSPRGDVVLQHLQAGTERAP